MRTRNAGKELLVKQRAMEMLVADGFEGFSVNKLAKACDISVATLYIYYKDKDDLITKIGLEEGQYMTSVVFRDFDADMSFAEGLRKQWENRFAWMMQKPTSSLFLESLRNSSYGETVFKCVTNNFKEMMEKFTKNAVRRGEINKMSLEAFWATAFAPLYTLVRFHNEGRSIGGKPFTMSSKVLWETFDIVLKGLTK
ncbi:MAG TPA: TetR/AcrR family transcriptional regulator [Chitinophagaceae bacterium]|nr:TetR/AcrR family transcriptional regulator [Chitinophagaceae bacterium]